MWVTKSTSCGGAEFESLRAVCARRIRRRARLPALRSGDSFATATNWTILRALWLAVRLGTDCRSRGAGASAGEGIAEAALESAVAHRARGVLCGAARQSRGRSHPCAPRLFRLMDRHGGGANTGSELQPDVAWVRPAGARCLPRHEAEALPILHDHFRIQPPPHFEKLSRSRSAKSHRLASGCRRTGKRGIAEGCPGHTPHLHIAGGGTAACGEGSRVSDSRMCATARWGTRF